MGGKPPSTWPYYAVTHLILFAVHTSPNRNGTIDTSRLSGGQAPIFVRGAHDHGKVALLSIGGVTDPNWDGACNSANRAKFVNNLVALMQQYGFDGLDLDVEQDWGFPAYTDYTACVHDIRAKLDTIAPRPLLTEPAVPQWQAGMLSHVWKYLDQINLMSYWEDVPTVIKELGHFTSAGIPKRLLGVGIGLGADGGVDTTAAKCDAKMSYLVNNGYGGVMEWLITDQGPSSPCLDAMAKYVP